MGTVRKVSDYLPQVLKTTDESLSLVRHSILAIRTPRIESDPLKPLAFIGIGLGIGLGGYEIKKGRESYLHAKEISDKETTQRAEGRIFSGSLVTSGALVSLAGKISHIFSIIAASFCSLSADLLFGIGATFAMGMSSLGIYRCKRFLDRLDAQDPENALQFLLEKATITREEKEELEQTFTGDELLQKLTERAEAKMKYFKRRTSSKAFQLLVDRVVRLGTEKDEGAADAELVQAIRREVQKKIVLFSVALVAAAVALTAIFLGSYASLGAMPFILYAISSSIYLGLGVYSLLGKKTAPLPHFRDTAPEKS